MPPTSKTPPIEGGASRGQLGGWSHPVPTLGGYQAQFLMLAHAVRPELAAMLAGLAFGGQVHG